MSDLELDEFGAVVVHHTERDGQGNLPEGYHGVAQHDTVKGVVGELQCLGDIEPHHTEGVREDDVEAATTIDQRLRDA